MSYLQLLHQQKVDREKYEQEERELREAITECNNLFSLHDGDFLIKLKKFINDYKDQKQHITNTFNTMVN